MLCDDLDETIFLPCFAPRGKQRTNAPAVLRQCLRETMHVRYHCCFIGLICLEIRTTLLSGLQHIGKVLCRFTRHSIPYLERSLPFLSHFSTLYGRKIKRKRS